MIYKCKPVHCKSSIWQLPFPGRASVAVGTQFHQLSCYLHIWLQVFFLCNWVNGKTLVFPTDWVCLAKWFNALSLLSACIEALTRFIPWTIIKNHEKSLYSYRVKCPFRCRKFSRGAGVPCSCACPFLPWCFLGFGMMFAAGLQWLWCSQPSALCRLPTERQGLVQPCLRSLKACNTPGKQSPPWSARDWHSPLMPRISPIAILNRGCNKFRCWVFGKEKCIWWLLFHRLRRKGKEDTSSMFYYAPATEMMTH